ncbi:MAG TPA: alanine racemase C-terminal domain-containing protein, partial [Bacteroidota bacterium]
AGTVCMDHCMIDAGPGSDVRAGDAAVLIGTDGAETVSAWDLAETMGTIPYEVTCLLTARIPRVAASGGEARVT